MARATRKRTRPHYSLVILHKRNLIARRLTGDQLAAIILGIGYRPDLALAVRPSRIPK